MSFYNNKQTYTPLEDQLHFEQFLMLNCQAMKKRIILTPRISIPHPRLILQIYLHEVEGTR